jgi:sensor domain CHASE-containing protein
MRYLVFAALVTALLGACSLALGLSAADAVDQAVARHSAGVENPVSW